MVPGCSTFGSATNPTDGGPDGSTTPPGVLDGSLRPSLNLETRNVKVRRGAQVTLPFQVTPAGLKTTVAIQPQIPGVAVLPISIDQDGKGIATLTVDRTTPTKTFTLSAVAIVEGVESLAVRVDVEVEGLPGDIDDSFGDMGRVEESASNFVVTSSVLMPDDGILLGGSDSVGAFVRRILPTGKVDQGFGVAGTCRFPQPYATVGSSVDSVGRSEGVVLAGLRSATESSVFRIDGACQPKKLAAFGAEQVSVNYVGQRVAPNRIVVGGQTSGGLGTLAALDVTTGQIETGWGTSGRVTQAAGVMVDFVAGATDIALMKVTDKAAVLFQYSDTGVLIRPRDVVLSTNTVFLGGALIGMVYHFALFDLTDESMFLMRFDALADKYDTFAPRVTGRSRQTTICRCLTQLADGLAVATTVPKERAKAGAPSVLVTKLSQTGELVETFGVSGNVEARVAPQSAQSSTPIAILKQKSGRIVVANSFVGLGNNQGVSLTRMWP